MSKFVTLHGFGGSGSDLNFEIVGGTTQPENPKENTIWVNTDVEISSWVFSVTEPEELTEGLVWIYIGTSSPVKFNALKSKTLQVYPVETKQYSDGKWNDVIAFTYQNDEWCEWIPDGALYYKGNEMSAKTGGWSAYAWVPNGAYTNNGFTFEKSEDHMSLNARPSIGSGGRDWAISSNNKIDMSKYNTLCIDAEHSWKACKFGLSSVKPSSSTTVSWVTVQNLQQSRIETTLDVSTCNSSYYVVIWLYSDQAINQDCNVYKILAK